MNFRNFKFEKIVYAGIIVSFLLMIFYPLLISKGDELEISCMFKSLTGYPCPTCGMSRSFKLFVFGDFQESIKYSLITIPLYIFYFYLFLQSFKALVLKRDFGINKTLTWLFFIALLIGWGWKFIMGPVYY
ncbi:DUF2752 domain-containing protein [Puteibacter caeruleilacunae]|nr:DUF2752 domain-containing protein [Puteibacter caeruleilacunae]